MCVSGDKKCLFFGNFGVLCFLETPVLRFALLPYSRRTQDSTSDDGAEEIESQADMSFLHVSEKRNFQNNILFLLLASYVHVVDSLRLNKWCNIRVSKGYFVAKYKKIVESTAYCFRFANVFAFFTFMHNHCLDIY